MFKKLGTALSAVALAGLVLSPCMAFAADASTASEKSETVNVTTDASGAVEKVEVEATLKNADSVAELLDSSELTDIEGKDDATFKESGSELVWQADGDDVTYTGQTEASLPISIKVTYRLDGKEVTPSEIAGKTGDVSIRYDFENTSTLHSLVNGAEDDMHIPFTCITALMLDGDVFSDVKVENGKVIDDGSDIIVAGYAMPGLKQSLGSLADESDIPDYFEVSAKAEEFELKSGMTIVTAGLMADMDVDELGFDDLDDVSSGLTEGMSQLVSGADALTSGMSELAGATDQLSGSVDQLSGYASTLSGGLYALAYGNDGKTGLKGAASKTDALEQDLDGVGSGLDALADSDKGLPAAASGLSAVAATYDSTSINNLESKIEGLDTSAMSDADKQAIIQILESTKQVSDISQKLTAGTAELSTLATQYAEVANGAKTLIGGVNDAVTAVESLYALSGGLAQGTEQLSGGMQQLSSGMQGAADGSGALAKGLVTFDEQGISKIVSAIDDDLGGLKRRLAELSDAASAYDNFSGKAADTTSSVKFVYETAAIEAE